MTEDAAPVADLAAYRRTRRTLRWLHRALAVLDAARDVVAGTIEEVETLSGLRRPAHPPARDDSREGRTMPARRPGW